MTTALFRNVDLETSAKDDGEVIEVGVTDLWFTVETKEVAIAPTQTWLFRPLRGLHPGAQAVHHLTMNDLDGQPVCTPDDLTAIAALGAPQFLVAHNAEFEQRFFTPETMPAGSRWVCTFKAALRAWEEAPEHNLQALRYWRGLELDHALAMPPHRAGPDSYVGACILAELLKTERAVDLVRWTMAPRHYRACPIGQWRGRLWTEVPMDFLKWMTISARDLEPDVKAAASAEISRRLDTGA